MTSISECCQKTRQNVYKTQTKLELGKELSTEHTLKRYGKHQTTFIKRELFLGDKTHTEGVYLFKSTLFL